MNKFSWTRAIGYGISLWLIMFILGSIMVAGLSLTLSVVSMVALAVIAGFVAYGFGVETKAATAGQAFAYGALWVAIGVVLDLLITNPLQPGMFSIWTYWLGYFFVLFAPMAAMGIQQQAQHAV